MEKAVPAPPARFHLLCASAGLSISPGQEGVLRHYLDLMLETNRQFNLTSVRDPNEAWVRHVFDSLLLLSHLKGAKSCIDIGSGAGLPGIPLAIMRPDLRVTLLEATRKKADFLIRTAETLELSNINVLCDRAENAGHDPAHRGRYDAAVVRAVGSIAELAELAIPLLGENGVLLAMKGSGAPDEVRAAARALRILRARAEDVQMAGEGAAVSWIVAVRKTGPTPAAYPRLPGTPKKTPL
ncbi:MAG: 16S rRNA (guanine(527)-N(7))-methyltransferase RsmG [Kiritimatiellae bacterium]|nr:16S rRNA (guanine(527)-N(7))-methyltransferase RsmG [Kiritimatiellia bacterium]